MSPNDMFWATLSALISLHAQLQQKDSCWEWQLFNTIYIALEISVVGQVQSSQPCDVAETWLLGEDFVGF